MRHAIWQRAMAVLLALGVLSSAAEASCTWLRRCVIKHGHQYCEKRKICTGY